MTKKIIFISLIITLVAIVLIMIILNFNPFRKQPPEGVPNDYFDHINTISKLDIDIKIYGLGVTLPKKINYTPVTKLDYDQIYTDKKYKFLVIDMKYINSLSKDDIKVINDLYYKCGYNVFILDLDETKYEYFEDLVDYKDRNEPFIMLRFLSNGGPYYSNALRDPFRNPDQKEYAIMDMILRTIKKLET